jgi:hypothetical protein
VTPFPRAFCMVSSSLATSSGRVATTSLPQLCAKLRSPAEDGGRAPFVGKRPLLQVVVQHLASFHAEAGFEHAGRVVETRMNDLTARSGRRGAAERAMREHLFLELIPDPIMCSFSRTYTCSPRSAKARADARPTTPAPTTHTDAPTDAMPRDALRELAGRNARSIAENSKPRDGGVSDDAGPFGPRRRRRVALGGR